MKITKRALIVGINHYANAPLKGCVGDAQKMKEVLEQNPDGSPNFDCKLKISREESKYPITTSRLKEYLIKLFTHEADMALFYFSGHGATNQAGNYLVTQDASRYNEGVSLQEIITMANNSKVKEAIIIIDACHSGHLGNVMDIGNRKALLREGVSVLTSSRDTQYSVERNGAGLFTSLVYEALQGGAADLIGNINISRIYTYADQLLSSWEQRPIFKSHLSQMISLRKLPPKIPLHILRKLPNYFTNKEESFSLKPIYEESIPPYNTTFEGIMEHLRLFYVNGLLIPHDASSMYHAAKEHKSCILTALGKFYWELADKGRI
ncbi:caspase family protein [Aquimarina rhabdastrellae]